MNPIKLSKQFKRLPVDKERIHRRSLSSLKYQDVRDPKNSHSRNEKLMFKINTLSRRRLVKMFFTDLKQKGLEYARIGHYVHTPGKEGYGDYEGFKVHSFKDLNKIPTTLLQELTRIHFARSIRDEELFHSEHSECCDGCQNCPRCKHHNPAH